MNNRRGEWTDTVANGLGWFSIGLGVAEMMAPSAMARWIGVQEGKNTRGVMRFYGAREIAAGVGILTQRDRAKWLWARVGGDLLDLATLSQSMAGGASDYKRLSTATAAVLGVTALDVICAQQMSASPRARMRASQSSKRRVVKSVRINRPVEDVYAFFRDFENLPRFMKHLESVNALEEGLWHWRAKGPAGSEFAWDARLVEDRPNEVIAWRSTENADVYNAGIVLFETAPGGRGTILRIEMDYAPPGGTVGAYVAKLFGEEPEQQVAGDLKRLKAILEAGEVVQSDSSIHKGMHPAQPSAESMEVMQ